MGPDATEALKMGRQASLFTLGAQAEAAFHYPAKVAAINLGGAALGKLLYSPRAVKLLTEGMKPPVGNASRVAAISAHLSTLLGNQLRLPLAAQNQSEQPVQATKIRGGPFSRSALCR
jgi:hypothetical protein